MYTDGQSNTVSDLRILKYLRIPQSKDIYISKDIHIYTILNPVELLYLKIKLVRIVIHQHKAGRTFILNS